MAEAPLRSAEIVHIPLDPQARLRAALRMLETRLEAQRACLATWRDELSNLSALSRGLLEGAEACQRSVDDLAGRIADARQAAATSHRTAARLIEATTTG